MCQRPQILKWPRNGTRVKSKNKYFELVYAPWRGKVREPRGQEFFHRPTGSSDNKSFFNCLPSKMIWSFAVSFLIHKQVNNSQERVTPTTPSIEFIVDRSRKHFHNAPRQVYEWRPTWIIGIPITWRLPGTDVRCRSKIHSYWKGNKAITSNITWRPTHFC